MTMTKSKRIRTALAFIGIIAAFFVLVNGCASLKSSKKDSESSTKEQNNHPKPTLVAKIEEAKKPNQSDPEVIDVLNMLDKLLADLPEETIQSFAKSKDFAKYEKVMSKYKQK